MKQGKRDKKGLTARVHTKLVISATFNHCILIEIYLLKGLGSLISSKVHMITRSSATDLNSIRS